MDVCDVGVAMVSFWYIHTKTIFVQIGRRVPTTWLAQRTVCVPTWTVTENTALEESNPSARIMLEFITADQQAAHVHARTVTGTE